MKKAYCVFRNVILWSLLAGLSGVITWHFLIIPEKEYGSMEELLEDVQVIQQKSTAEKELPQAPSNELLFGALGYLPKLDFNYSFVSILDEDEVEELAKGIYFEARNQSFEGQVSVGEVILNRRDDDRWPNTVHEVLAEGGTRRDQCQFSYMCDGKPEHIKEKAAWKIAQKAAKLAMEARFKGETGCAHSYHANYVTSKKALSYFKKLSEEKRLGSHIFYCDTDA